jgi:hypothetical protein
MASTTIRAHTNKSSLEVAVLLASMTSTIKVLKKRNILHRFNLPNLHLV